MTSGAAGQTEVPYPSHSVDMSRFWHCYSRFQLRKPKIKKTFRKSVPVKKILTATFYLSAGGMKINIQLERSINPLMKLPLMRDLSCLALTVRSESENW